MNEIPPMLENTIQYQLSRKECIGQVIRLLFRPSLIFTLGGVFLFGVLMIIFAHSGDWPAVAWIFVVSPVLMLFFLSRNARKIVDEHPELLEPQTVTFDAAGVTITNSVSRVQWPWQRVLSVKEKAGFIVLRCSSLGAGGFIPARAFAPGQRERFLSLAQARSGSGTPG